MICHVTIRWKRPWKCPIWPLFTIFLSELPVWRSVGHKINIFQISAKNASIWGTTWTIHPWFYLIHIMTVGGGKMFLTVPRDLSTHKQQRGMWTVSSFKLSDKKVKKKNYDHNLSDETVRGNFDLRSISWPSDRVLWK